MRILPAILFTTLMLSTTPQIKAVCAAELQDALDRVAALEKENAVLRRLEALERENAALRQRLGRSGDGSTARRPVSDMPRARIGERPEASPLVAHASAAPAGIPAVRIYNWTGVYVGAHTGWAAQTSTVADAFSVCALSCSSGPATRDLRFDGWAAGVQAGGNYQLANLVIGGEASFSWADRNGFDIASLTVPGGGSFVASDLRTWAVHSDWIATGTARLGYAWDTWLFYVKGGLAVTQIDYRFSDLNRSSTDFGSISNFLQAAASKLHIGWTSSIGGEWAFANSWSAFVEYTYLDFGNEDVGVGGTRVSVASGNFCCSSNGSFADDVSFQNRIHMLKLGLNYRFGPLDAFGQGLTF